MKTLISYVAVAALILTSSFTMNVQQKLNEQATVSGFNYLRAHRQAKNVVVTWSVNSTDVVTFAVLRSYDGDFYEPIGTVDFNGSASYKFKDLGVYPGRIYYRITAVHSDGTTESSSDESVRIVQR
jgi:hypothetical protein